MTRSSSPILSSSAAPDRSDSGGDSGGGGSGSGARSDRWNVALIVACFAILSIAASLASPGFLEADGCTHYLYARFAFAEPHYLANIWGRPVCTALYALPAQIAGRFGVRCCSLLLGVGCGLVAYAIARRQNHARPALALLFTLAQPLLFMHSFSELTELPFALLLGLCFLAYQDRRWWLLAIVASLLPLSRPEGFGFLLLAAVALLMHRRSAWLIVLPVPLIAWSYAGWHLYGSPPQYPWYRWLIENWPYAQKSAYRAGSILHFVSLLPAVTSPIIFPAMVLGIWLTIAPDRNGNRMRRFFDDHKTRCDLLIALIPLAILAGHSILYATGRMASSGELRYMLIVAPFWGVLAARGWTWFFRRIRKHEPLGRRLRYFEMRLAALAALSLIVFNRTYQVIPIFHDRDAVHAQEVAQWIARTPLGRSHPKLMSAHPMVFYFLGISQTSPGRTVPWLKQNVQHPPPGTMMVWDSTYGQYNSDASRIVALEEILRAGWIEIRAPSVNTGTRQTPSAWRVFISPDAADERRGGERFSSGPHQVNCCDLSFAIEPAGRRCCVEAANGMVLGNEPPTGFVGITGIATVAQREDLA